MNENANRAKRYFIDEGFDLSKEIQKLDSLGDVKETEEKLNTYIETAEIYFEEKNDWDEPDIPSFVVDLNEGFIYKLEYLKNSNNQEAKKQSEAFLKDFEKQLKDFE